MKIITFNQKTIRNHDRSSRVLSRSFNWMTLIFNTAFPLDIWVKNHWELHTYKAYTECRVKLKLNRIDYSPIEDRSTKWPIITVYFLL